MKNKLLIVTGGMDKTIIIWQIINKNGKINIEPFQKLLGFLSHVTSTLYLGDNSSLVTGDAKGEIIIWDFNKAKILYAFRGQHNSKIVNMNLLKSGDKFVVASMENTISIWRIKNNNKPFVYNYPNKNDSPESSFNNSIEYCVCERIIVDNFGGISCMIAPTLSVTLNEIIVLGCFDGHIRLYDISRKTFVGDSFVHKNGINELCLIGDLTTSLTVLSLSQNESYLGLSNFSKKDSNELSFKTLQRKIENFDNFITCSENKPKFFFQEKEKEGFRLVLVGEKSKEISFYELTNN